jgi:ABC-type lipoprotein release transport system permease subunit
MRSMTGAFGLMYLKTSEVDGAVPVALLLANLLATVPADRAARLRPAEVLRTE